MKNFCEYLREHAKNIFDFEKKQMLLLRKEELKSINKQKHVTFGEKNLKRAL